MNFYKYQKWSNIKVFKFTKKDFAKTSVDPVQKSPSLQESYPLSPPKEDFGSPSWNVASCLHLFALDMVTFWKFYAILVSKGTTGEKSEMFLESLIPPSSCQCRQCSLRGCPLWPCTASCSSLKEVVVGQWGCLCVSHLSFKLKQAIGIESLSAAAGSCIVGSLLILKYEDILQNLCLPSMPSVISSLILFLPPWLVLLSLTGRQRPQHCQFTFAINRALWFSIKLLTCIW